MQTCSKLIELIVVLTILLMLPKLTYSCSCCADPGTWSIAEHEMSDYMDALLSELDFEGVLTDDEGLKGSSLVNYWRAPLTIVEYANRQIRFEYWDTIRDIPNGLITFKFSSKYEVFKTDLIQDQGHWGTELYKEIRFVGSISGGDADVPIASDEPAFLIFQGKGNDCLSEYDFYQWILKFKVKKGEVWEKAHLYGKCCLERELCLDELKNASYYFSPDSDRAPLNNGYYFKKHPEYAFSNTELKWGNMMAYGELNNKGEKDAAITLRYSGGGNSSYVLLEGVINDNGLPENTAFVNLGDPIKVKSITISEQKIYIDMLIQGSNDAQCCPSKFVTHVYQLQDNQLVKLTN